jgi:hypothetical protein
MPLHLIKLCVGAESIADLEDWIGRRLRDQGRHIHTTRMMPKRRDEILDGGSLYWVIRGQLSCRQAILGLTQRRDGDGVSFCDIHLDPAVHPVDPRPRGPFQGWRYFAAEEVPPDLRGGGGDDTLPLDLQREFRLIGLL